VVRPDISPESAGGRGAVIVGSYGVICTAVYLSISYP